MAEAGDLLLARQLAPDERVDAIGRRVLPDLDQHLHHFRVGAAVQRPLQGADAATTAEWMSVSVAAATRAANVEAFSS